MVATLVYRAARVCGVLHQPGRDGVARPHPTGGMQAHRHPPNRDFFCTIAEWTRDAIACCISHFEIVCPPPFCRLRLQVQEKGRPYCLELLVCSAQAAVRCNAGDASATRNELTLLLAQGIKGLHSRYILDCESEAAQGAGEAREPDNRRDGDEEH